MPICSVCKPMSKKPVLACSVHCEFLDAASSQPHCQCMHGAAQIATGLRIYFDKALPQQLLYASEREQADQARPPPTPRAPAP